jgi:hypothetical protein
MAKSFLRWSLLLAATGFGMAHADQTWAQDVVNGVAAPAEAEAQAKDIIGGTDTPGATSTEINPFEALGRYEAATTNRNIAQIKHELEVRLAFKPDANESNAARAIRMCVIGRLKKRLGHNDAYDYLTKAIELDPVEPGLELWAGEYWTGARGSKRPVTEPAERHFYRGLEKLEALKKAGKRREYHDIVESWIHKQLIVLYQQDGQPLFPWKAYPQRGIAGLYAPGLSLQSMFQVASDTRDFWFNNEMRIFTAEAAWSSSDLRGRGTLKQLTDREIYDIARAPLRWQADNRVRLRHNWLGTFDLAHSYFRAYQSQVTSYYTPSGPHNDVTVQQIGPSYERVFPLYPLFDFRVSASYRRVHRNGVIEFLENRDVSNEDFNLYELKPSISRFLGPNKLTIEGVYADLQLPTNSAAPPGEGARRKLIRGVTFEFGLYTPMVLPTFESGSFGTYRTPTRGWYFYGGAIQDEEVYGIKTVTARDAYFGTRFEGAGKYDFTLQGIYSSGLTTFINRDVEPYATYTEPGQEFSSARALAVIQYRIINQDAYPATDPGAFVSDMLNLVIPITYDRKLTGLSYYENVRAGAELWWKFAGNGIGGTTFLVTAGYGAQLFYNIDKWIHNARLAVRMGWGDL